ncbi:methyltransferase family protein [Pontibacter ummariensis]|uniref:Methyltransferase domain-containing protein n=1 Tax=Pontibacter ummariensis TaxID=1610492 RepID=A0A239EJJ5_9BACT|nr:class I SAM-dependent methyltransferase [Pontibacter ummariensis]PRY13300.1 methyltransferase family protein [Pontibacter ummariensis]SNS44940.1 Methyltransferase domain-containing protein [Pontibacter ummariensis]
MASLRLEQWEQSYSRQENYIFYPKEEVVKFLNRFVKKKTGVDTYQNHLVEEQKLKGLDLGCGIGRQVILLEEFGIEGYGVDIASNALKMAQELAQSLGFELADRFVLLQKAELPFHDNFFDIAICDSVLDSMEFSNARKYMQELNRTVKRLVYLSLICTDASSGFGARDMLVQSEHEKGTIQSFYNERRINRLIAETGFKIRQLHKLIIKNQLSNTTSARFHVVLEK